MEHLVDVDYLPRKPYDLALASALIFLLPSMTKSFVSSYEQRSSQISLQQFF